MKSLLTTPNEIWILDSFYTPLFDKELSDAFNNEVWKDQIVAREIHGDKKICTTDTLNSDLKNIFKNTLVITYDGPKHLSILLKSGWSLPSEVIDIKVEYSRLKNGLSEKVSGHLNQLANNFVYRSRALEVMPYDRSPFAMIDLIDYLYVHLTNTHNINLDQAKHRGRFIKAISQVQINGIPIDYYRYAKLPSKQQVVNHYSKEYDVFTGTSICPKLLARYCDEQHIELGVDLFSKEHISCKELKQLTSSTPELKEIYHISCLLQGNDKRLLHTDPGTFRNTAYLNPFGTTTGRNNPKLSEFIYGQPKWIRSLIKPEKNTSLAYIDWNQQEFGIAAALSNDAKMIDAYLSGDPYLQFAIRSGSLPSDATKETHPEGRNRYKQAVLAIQYGIGPKSLSSLLNSSESEAERIISQFYACYKSYANWCFHQINQALFCGEIHTPFGWNRRICRDTSENSIKNYPVQAYGAELMREATCLLIESGIKVCSTIHDAFLIESTTDQIEVDVNKAQQHMVRASTLVLDGFELSSEAQIVSYPYRFSDNETESIWDMASSIIRGLRNE